MPELSRGCGRLSSLLLIVALAAALSVHALSREAVQVMPDGGRLFPFEQH